MKTMFVLALVGLAIGIAAPAFAANYTQVPLSAIGGHDRYVGDDGSVWTDDNGNPGLDTEDIFDEEGNLLFPHDTQDL